MLSAAEWIKVYPASWVLNTNVDLESDTKSPYFFEDFSVFQLQKAVRRQRANHFQGAPLQVHRVQGIPVPEDKNTTFDYKYLYWGHVQAPGRVPGAGQRASAPCRKRSGT